MSKLTELKTKVQTFWKSTEPARSKTGRVLYAIGDWIYKLRGLLLSIPVAIAAIKLAIQNSERLPETVGVNLLASGDYQWMISRNMAVLAPVAVTALCLLMMFCSRRVVYPWLISIFSLAIPILLWVTNVFPA